MNLRIDDVDDLHRKEKLLLHKDSTNGVITVFYSRGNLFFTGPKTLLGCCCDPGSEELISQTESQTLLLSLLEDVKTCCHSNYLVTTELCNIYFTTEGCGPESICFYLNRLKSKTTQQMGEREKMLL